MSYELETEGGCPYCGQPVGLRIDTTLSAQRFVTDCEVCCRPIEVVVSCESGEILSLELRPD